MKNLVPLNFVKILRHDKSAMKHFPSRGGKCSMTFQGKYVSLKISLRTRNSSNWIPSETRVFYISSRRIIACWLFTFVRPGNEFNWNVDSTLNADLHLDITRKWITSENVIKDDTNSVNLPSMKCQEDIFCIIYRQFIYETASKVSVQIKWLKIIVINLMIDIIGN